jgi:hypothetical protein
MSAVANYFRTLSSRFGDGWNRFWFAPSDACTLSTIRLLTGLLLLYWYGAFGFDLVRLFADGGWLPVEAVRQVDADNLSSSGIAPFSYLNFMHRPQELWIAFGLGFIPLVMFTFGLATRIGAILTLIVVLSFIHRAPMLGSQFEPVVSFVLAYLCIGRSGDYHSIDSVLRRRRADAVGQKSPAPASAFNTISQRLIQVHLAGLYAVMGLSKLMGDPWWTGLGTWWLMTRSESRLVDLTWLPPQIVEVLTHSVVLFELVFPILIWNRLARPLLLGISVVMWTLMALMTGQVLFSLMMLIASLAFLSPAPVRHFCAPFSICCRTEPAA